MSNPCRCPSGLPKYFLGHTEEVRTVATHPTAEQMDALEVRLQEAEKRLENLYKASEVDRLVAKAAITSLEAAFASLQASTARKRPARSRRAKSSRPTRSRINSPSGGSSRAPASSRQKRGGRRRSPRATSKSR